MFTGVKLNLQIKVFHLHSSSRVLEMAAPKLPAGIQASIDGTKVSYAQLGSSGLRVSVPILGAMSLGTKEWMDWVIEEDEALQLLKGAWDRGIPFALPNP